MGAPEQGPSGALSPDAPGRGQRDGPDCLQGRASGAPLVYPRHSSTRGGGCGYDEAILGCTGGSRCERHGPALQAWGRGRPLGGYPRCARGHCAARPGAGAGRRRRCTLGGRACVWVQVQPGCVRCLDEAPGARRGRRHAPQAQLVRAPVACREEKREGRACERRARCVTTSLCHYVTASLCREVGRPGGAVQHGIAATPVSGSLEPSRKYATAEHHDSVAMQHGTVHYSTAIYNDTATVQSHHEVTVEHSTVTVQ